MAAVVELKRMLHFVILYHRFVTWYHRFVILFHSFVILYHKTVIFLQLCILCTCFCLCFARAMSAAGVYSLTIITVAYTFANSNAGRLGMLLYWRGPGQPLRPV